MCVEICADTCVDMSIDMCADICVDMSRRQGHAVNGLSFCLQTPPTGSNSFFALMHVCACMRAWAHACAPGRLRSTASRLSSISSTCMRVLVRARASERVCARTRTHLPFRELHHGDLVGSGLIAERKNCVAVGCAPGPLCDVCGHARRHV